MNSPAVVGFDPLRDKRYQSTRLGRDVADFLAWLELGGASPRTLDQYERDLSRGALMFPNHALNEWTDAELLHVANAFKAPERRVRMAAYRSFFKWARQTRRITENPTELLPTIKRTPQRVIDVFSDEEIAVLCDLPVRDGALMQLLFDAGLRKSEARNLRLMHVVDDVRVLRGKGGKDRIIPATVVIAQKVNELAILDGLTARDHLWYSRPGGGSTIARDKPIGDGSFDRWWRRCLDDADVRYRNPHVARHTFATRWLKRGGRITTLSTAMGHASIATTYDLYGHLDTRDLEADLALITDRSES
jgi:site-specific recombinase XerD